MRARKRWIEERRNERGRRTHVRSHTDGQTDRQTETDGRTSSSRRRIERVRATTTILRSQGRSLLLPRSGDLSGMYYPPFARYDDPSSLLSSTLPGRLLACSPACLLVALLSPRVVNKDERSEREKERERKRARIFPPRGEFVKPYRFVARERDGGSRGLKVNQFLLR